MTDAESDAEQLSDELLAIEMATVEDGQVEAIVQDVESVSETKIRLRALLPNGEAVSWKLEKPIPWSDEYLFVRIMEEKGLSAANVHQLEGEAVLTERDGDGSWELADPASSWDRVRGLMESEDAQAVLLALGFVVFPLGVGLALFSPPLAKALVAIEVWLVMLAGILAGPP